MPLYTLRNNATGETVQTTDPGRALITGQWADIGKFKGPILRGAGGARAVLPQRLGGDARRGGGLLQHALQHRPHGQEKADLVAFLRAL